MEPSRRIVEEGRGRNYLNNNGGKSNENKNSHPHPLAICLYSFFVRTYTISPLRAGVSSDLQSPFFSSSLCHRLRPHRVRWLGGVIRRCLCRHPTLSDIVVDIVSLPRPASQVSYARKAGGVEPGDVILVALINNGCVPSLFDFG